MRSDLAHLEADFLLFQTEAGRTRVEVRFDGDAAWLAVGQMAQDLKKPSGDAA